jgi:hypothetical protein
MAAPGERARGGDSGARSAVVALPDSTGGGGGGAAGVAGPEGTGAAWSSARPPGVDGPGGIAGEDVPLVVAAGSVVGAA